jgi:cytochrome P450
MTAAARPAPTSPILTPEFQEDWLPIIHRLREEDPVHFVPGLGFWFVTRYDDVKRLFTDENATPDRRVWEHYVPAPEGTFTRWASDHGLFSLPPEEHARVRRLVSAAFTPRAVARMEEQAREVVDRFAAPLRGRTGVVDLMAEFTDPIPNAVISRITGVPPAGDDEVRFRELAQATIRGFFAFGDEELARRGEQAFAELAGWVRELAAERRAEPRDDLVSDLVRAQASDEKLLDDEIVILVTGLIGAGSETTALGGMIALVTLLEHPDELARLRADRSLLPSAVNEILRFGFGGPGGLPRYAVRDFELRGKPIRRGQMLMLSFAGAGRDPAVYADPDRFDLERNPKDLLTFGNGAHFCLGANLARAELRWMLDAALDFLPEHAVFSRDRMEFSPMGVFRRPVTLPVDFGGA